MSDNTTNNKKIAKNSLLLYVRMAFLMIVSLFTSRVILETLGIDDYGIFNVVGGLVAMFTILSGSFTSAITRFITFELGKNNQKRLNSVFSTSMNIQIGISIIVFFVAEIVGLWFLNYKMNIPVDRMEAANIVLQCSLGIFVVNLISIPYHAELIAHEHMGTYAYISILDVLLKLAIAYVIFFMSIDRLSSYAILLLLEALFIRLIYGLYCKRKFEECTYRFVNDKTMFIEMAKFAGWNFLGVCAGTLNTQGVNILMNLYFNVSVNAARGVAVQAGAAISQFVHSFTTAVNPQITKSYAAGNIEYLHSLVCKSAKFSTYLFLLIAIPLSIEAPMIFSIWLKDVPDFSIIFFRLSILTILIDNVLANPIRIAVFATGDIRKYQMKVTLVGALVFPITWIAYLLGTGPEWTYIIYFLVYCFVLVVRLKVLSDKVDIPVYRFTKDVLFNILPIIFLSYTLEWVIVSTMEENILRVFFTAVICTVLTCMMIYMIGLTKGEKSTIVNKIQNFITGKKN